VTDPLYWPNSLELPAQSLALDNPSSRTCNSYLQSPAFSTALDRLIWATHFFVGNGFYVMLNYHDNSMADNIYNNAELVADK
jgi:hypothetical protein